MLGRPKAKPKAKATPTEPPEIPRVGRGVRVACLPDPKKFGKKPGYPKPGLRDRLLEGGFEFVIVTPEQIRRGGLQSGGFHVFVVPGGFAPNTAEALGELGSRRVREFVAAGGGYVGICAGAYMGTTWGFGLLPVDVLDIDHWNRGKTDNCRLRSTPAGARLLGSVLPEALCVRYANGPLLDILDDSVETVIVYESELRGKRGTFPALMRGSPAVVAGPHGKGRVVLISPHPEGKPLYGDVLRALFKWTADAGTPLSAPAAAKASAAEAVAAGLALPEKSSPPAPPRPDPAQLEEELSRLSYAIALVEQFKVLDRNRDGNVDREELVEVMRRLDDTGWWTDRRIDNLIAVSDSNRDGRIQFDEFADWVFGDTEEARALQEAMTKLSPPLEGAMAAPVDGAATDDEDSDLDVPALVRMRSDLEFGRPSGPTQSEEDAYGDAPPPPPLCLSRSCSCSGVMREVSASDMEDSVLKIQRAVRGRGLTEPKPHEATAKAPKLVDTRASARATSTSSGASPARPAGVSKHGEGLLARGGCDYVCWLQGTVLLTAPHSLKLVRGGGDTGSGSRNHLRERWTAEIVAALGRELHRGGVPASAIVWNRAAARRAGRLDPNYLTAEMFAASPWHRALHRWMLSAGDHGKAPLFHVDIHGKVSEKLHVDLGICPLEEVWPRSEQRFVTALARCLTASLDEALERCNVRSAKGKLIQVDPDPRLHGFWGEDTVTTISHQTVMFGVPAVQFEMPPRVRERLVQDPEFCRLFSNAIARAYNEVVVPWWSSHAESGSPRPATLKPVATLAADVVEQDLRGTSFEAWSSQLLAELLALERGSTEKQI